MLEIHDSRISRDNGKWVATCSCGMILAFSAKAGALKLLKRGTCRNCKRDYRNVGDHRFSVYRRADGKWCSRCSGCSVEQAYTRKDHAKQSEIRDWQCKKCVSSSRRFSLNRPVGDKARLYRRYMKSANSREIKWDLTIDQMFASYVGVCALTGWEISIGYSKQTASLDRIDSTEPYVLSNVQWVHSMVNMCKNKYSQEDFVKMCCSVADKAKW